MSGGYDTKGGWNGSAGWSAPLPPLGIVSFNTNMLGVSGSYSQNGGFSYNHMGVQINKSGMSFSPSVGVSFNYSSEQYYQDKAKREKRKSKNKYSHNVHEIEYTYFDDMTVGYGEYVEGPLSDKNVFRGVEIDITYNSGVSIEGAYWMQEITTDYPNAYDRRRAVVKKINNTLVYTYWDDGHGERNGRYYTEAEMKQHTSNNGKK